MTDGYILQQKKEFHPFLQVLLDKGLTEGLRILSDIDAAQLLEYLAGPNGKEAFNVQAVVIAFDGKTYEFVRGLVIGIAAGALLDPNMVHRDIRGGLAILANDGIDVMTGELREPLDLKPEEDG